MRRHAALIASFMFALTFPATALATVPSNNEIASATVVSSLPFGASQDTADATASASDPDCAGTGPTVWYRFRAAANTRLEVNTIGSSYDTTVSVYSGSRTALTSLACNDDAEGVQSRVRLDVQAGQTYWIMVGAYASGPGGSLVLTIQVAPPFVPLRLTMAINDSGTVRPSTGVARVSGTVTCNTPAWVHVYGQVRQKPAQRNSIGYFGVGVECSGTTAWTAEVAPELARFRGRSLALFTGGVALVSAGADGSTDESYEYVEATRSIRLRGSR